MDILRWWGGLFYLFNKVFLWRMIRVLDSNKKKWQISAWLIYLLGLPPWLVLFAFKSEWIVFCVELGGAPSMALGLIIGIRGKGKEPKWMNLIAYIGVVIGIVLSVYHVGFFTKFTQGLELMVSIGFLVGTILLAKKNFNGFICYMFMNAAMGTLLVVDGEWLLAVQQAISICFVFDSYRVYKKIQSG